MSDECCEIARCVVVIYVRIRHVSRENSTKKGETSYPASDDLNRSRILIIF